MIETVANNDEKQCNTEVTVVLHMKDAKVRMKIDTGAEVDVMPLRVFNQVNNRNKESILTLKYRSAKLIGHNGNEILVCGIFKNMQFPRENIAYRLLCRRNG